MKLDKLNGWLMLAANLGVLAGIIFLSMEIRQNTLAMRATAIQTAAALSREQMYILMQDPEVSRIDEVGGADLSELSPA